MLVIAGHRPESGRACALGARPTCSARPVYAEDPVAVARDLRRAPGPSGSTSSTRAARSAGRPVNEGGYARVCRGPAPRSRSAGIRDLARLEARARRGVPVASCSAPRRSRIPSSSRPACRRHPGRIPCRHRRAPGQGYRSRVGPRTGATDAAGLAAEVQRAGAAPSSSPTIAPRTAPVTAVNAAASTRSPPRSSAGDRLGRRGIARRHPKAPRPRPPQPRRGHRRSRHLHRRRRPGDRAPASATGRSP